MSSARAVVRHGHEAHGCASRFMLQVVIGSLRFCSGRTKLLCLRCTVPGGRSCRIELLLPRDTCSAPFSLAEMKRFNHPLDFSIYRQPTQRVIAWNVPFSCNFERHYYDWRPTKLVCSYIGEKKSSFCRDPLNPVVTVPFATAIANLAIPPPARSAVDVPRAGDPQSHLPYRHASCHKGRCSASRLHGGGATRRTANRPDIRTYWRDRDLGPEFQ